MGHLLIIKPSLTALLQEPTDIFDSTSATAFPQESTVDQWFDEPQFESYRRLGFALTQQALAKQPHIVT